ncbi:MAG: glutamate 5-kinase [Alphaproteobacteria bacterium]|nr:glutamate 5-kinase [Alphaproteobacteria bacterium]
MFARVNDFTLSTPIEPVSRRIRAAKRIVLKTGSVLVTDEVTGTPRTEWLSGLAADVRSLIGNGQEVVIVSSGAISLGRREMGIKRTIAPSSIPLDQKQAAAAVGQIALIRAFHDAFAESGLRVAQVLLSPRDTESRRSHINARETMQTLMQSGIVPIVNENDTVSTAEIRFGDNDRLAARVAQMVEADLVMLLSTIDGMYTADPRTDPQAEHIPHIPRIDEDIRRMAGDAVAGVSTGGMKSKIEAARIAVNAGAAMLIADGRHEYPIAGLLRDLYRSTWFEPLETPANARKRWIQAHVNTAGALRIDEGAVEALRSGKSLLPIGVRAVEGTFSRGDAVRVLGPLGDEVAIGLVAFNSDDAARITGLNSAAVESVLGYAGRTEMIHRKDMVLQLS